MKSGRGLPNRTSGQRDASRPQVRDQTEPSLPIATNTLNSGEAEQPATSVNLARPDSVTDVFLRQLVDRVAGSSGATWKLTEVYTGEVLVELPQSTPTDIEAAFATARAAQRKWAATPVKQRLAVFKRAHT